MKKQKQKMNNTDVVNEETELSAEDGQATEDEETEDESLVEVGEISFTKHPFSSKKIWKKLKIQ